MRASELVRRLLIAFTYKRSREEESRACCSNAGRRIRYLKIRPNRLTIMSSLVSLAGMLGELRIRAAFLNRQSQMTLKCMSEFPYPIRRLFIAPHKMSRVFDADNMWPTESRGRLFCRGSAFMWVAPIGGRREAVRCRANKSYWPVSARPADELHLPAAKSLAATVTHAVIVQRFPLAATVQPA
jgi:hypothetical protein